MADIVIINHDNKDSMVLATAIESIGHKAKLISDVSDAKLYLKSKEPDLIIAEQEMPGTSGISLFEYLQEKMNKIPPFILMCNISLSASAGIALQKGALDFLPKPVDPEEAITIIEHALNRRPLAIFNENQVSFEAEKDILIVKIPEQFMHEAAVQFSRLLNGGAIISERGVVVDLSQTRYMASIGIGMLQMLAASFSDSSERLYMCGAGPRIYHLLESAGIFHFFQYEEKVSDALEKINAL